MKQGEILTTRSARVQAILAHSASARDAAARTRTWRTGQTTTSSAQLAAWDILSDGSWKGQRCFIVGGGPSLKGFDFNRLRGERVIAVNKAYFDAPFADIMFAMDRPLLDLITSCKLGENYRQAFELFSGTKLWLDLSGYSYPAGIYSVPSAGEIGWTKHLKEGLYHGQNSGYGALNLAMVLGANPIYLLGYDCSLGPDGKKNYHDGYPSGRNPDALNRFLEAFKVGARMISPEHDIINLNPDSALRCFEFGDIDEIHDLGKREKSRPGWIVVSFYTVGTGYEQEIKNLEASLKKHGLQYHLFPCPVTGTWRGNLNHKSEIILKVFDMFPGKDIVFIDADAIVRRPPVLFDELSARHQYDLSAHFFKYDPKSGDADELLSGTLWIQNGDVGRALVKRWHEIGLARPGERHQMCLKLAIGELQKEGVAVRVNRHPFAYTYIFDYYAGRGIVPVIEHFQKSRQLRRSVGYGVSLIPGKRVQA